MGSEVSFGRFLPDGFRETGANDGYRMDFLVKDRGYAVEDARRTLGKQEGMVDAVNSLQARR